MKESKQQSEFHLGVSDRIQVLADSGAWTWTGDGCMWQKLSIRLSADSRSASQCCGPGADLGLHLLTSVTSGRPGVARTRSQCSQPVRERDRPQVKRAGQKRACLG